MASRQQKSAKTGPKMYLLNGPDLILIILNFDDGRAPNRKTTVHGFLKNLD